MRNRGSFVDADRGSTAQARWPAGMSRPMDDVTTSDVTIAKSGDDPIALDALLPRERGGHSPVTGLPDDLQAQAARRLRIVVALYVFAFVISNPVTAILSPDERREFFSSALRWAPSAMSIGAALFVAALTWSRRITADTVLIVGLVFEVVGSYGIAAAQYLDVAEYDTAPPWAGLSWVAVWMLGFTVMIPSPPGWALRAALGSASAVPVVAGVTMVTAPTPVAIAPLRFFLLIVLPYWLVVLIAFVCAQVIYRLGADLKRARHLGAYRLVERLGQGGMGEVWRARHRFLVRPAAVKLIRLDVRQANSPQLGELQARFEREAQATASLRSPHTIELYDFGIADDGTFYYVMELLDGFDLQALVDGFGPMPVERAVHLLTQVGHSLAEAHAAGLVHGDIKPSNVLVCRYGQDVDFVKVLDFGLVETLDANAEIAVTAGHTLRGTPAFMSPEQVLGTQPVDGRSDIYALGCLAYWLVTHQMVFTGRTAMETITQHTDRAPVPPSQRTELEIPEAFDRVVLACLEKRPDRRPATASVLAQQLMAITTRRSWTSDVAAAWWNAHYPRVSGP